jgi:hypothetical protein
MPAPVPLSTLLSWTWIAFTMEADNLFEERSTPHRGRAFRISLAFWANALRAIPPEGITVAALHEQTGAACNLGGLERWGWVTVGEPAAPRRPGFGTRRGIRADTMIRPSRLGEYARRAWPRVLEEVDAKWHDRFGAGPVDDLHRVLATTSTALPRPPVPWSPPEVHASDGFLTHVVTAERVDESKEAKRKEDAELPLATLLARAIVGLTLRHEAASVVSLPLAANALRAINPDGKRQRDLPERSGISKEAAAMAVGFLRRHDLVAANSAQTVALTPAGRQALADYETRVAAVDDPPLRRALDLILSCGDALVAGLVPPPGCWRAAPPYRRQTDRFLADPVAALPWHPMVLHRGGWPDGS